MLESKFHPVQQEIATLTDLAMPHDAPPRLICLDAVGTLFGVTDSVGAAYKIVAAQFGVDIPAAAIDQAFYAAFKSAPPMTFPGADPADIPQLEYDWWAELARQTFGALNLVAAFPNFDAFFRELYADFATARPWFVYPDVVPALTAWRSQGIPLAVVSNYDTRLYPVLAALDLNQWFDTVTISTEVGAAKPNTEIFHQAIAPYAVPPTTCWHIGVCRSMDYNCANEAGLWGIWLNGGEYIKSV